MSLIDPRPELNARPEAERSLELRDQAMLDQIEASFARARDAYPNALPCGRGCHYCCVAFFEVSALDLWRLRAGLLALPPEVRARVLEKARAVVALARGELPDWQAPFDVREVGERAFGALAQSVSAACPALGAQGECLVYEHRPRICRLQGLSFYDPAGGADLPDFCAETFGDEEYSSIPAQPLALFDQWEQESALRAEVSRLLPPDLAGGYRTFVAAALMALEDRQAEIPPVSL